MGQITVKKQVEADDFVPIFHTLKEHITVLQVQFGAGSSDLWIKP